MGYQVYARLRSHIRHNTYQNQPEDVFLFGRVSPAIKTGTAMLD